LTLPSEETLCVDLEAGLKSVQGWPGESISIRTFADAVDIACLIGGVDPAAPADGFFSAAHHRYLSETYPDLAARIAGKRIIFVDSITDLTRQAMA
jgi:AAA domain